MLAGVVSSASAAKTVRPLTVECTDHSLSALAAGESSQVAGPHFSQLRPQGLGTSLREEVVEKEVLLRPHRAVLQHCVEELVWFSSPIGFILESMLNFS